MKEVIPMFTATMEQMNKMVDKMWENWEDGFQKVYDFQKRMEENSLNAFKKQQDVIQSMKTNFNEAEEQLEKSFSQMKKSLDKNNKKIFTVDAARAVEGWSGKITEIMGSMQQLAITPSRSLLTMMEQSHTKMHDSVKKIVDEQEKAQTKPKEMAENFMTQVKEYQKNFLKVMEEQTKQLIENAQPI